MSKKILRVDKMLGSKISCFQDADQEKQVVNAFQKHGWQIVWGGEPDEANPLELGFHNYSEEGRVLAKETIAERAGLCLPRRYSKEELLTTDKPIVAKGVYADSGEDKYLLRSHEQKLRFLTWMMMGHNVKELCKRSNMNEVIDALKSAIMKGNFNSVWFLHFSIEDLFYFEEYVDNPGDHLTSYRLIVDGLGCIHYGYLTYSKDVKGVGIMDHHKYIAASDDPKEWAKPDHRLEIFLLRPNNPLFIASENFVSNISHSKGDRILLNGRTISDPRLGQILKAHNIDPDSPHIPKRLLHQAKSAGIVCKNMFPFVGVDFLQGKDGQFYFLEANAGPYLVNKFLGLPDSASWFQATMHLLEKIAKS